MPLETQRFNDMLDRLGRDLLWRQAAACPCTDPYSGSPDPQCPQCHGKGFMWGAGVTGTAGVSSQNASKQLREFGQYEQGDVILTIGSNSPLYALGHMDRVVLLNATERFSVTRTHGSDDALFDMPVVSIDRVFWLSPDKTQVIDGGIPRFDAAAKTLTWATGEPPAGTQYSISGTRNIEYFAWDNLPGNRNSEHGTLLPRKVQIRRFDLFSR